MPERVQRHGSRVVQGQLAHQVGTMLLDRLYAQSQFPGNRFVGLSQGDPCQNLALTTGHDFAGWARPAGVAAAGLLAARRAPFPVVVVVAAAVTALLRLAGIQLSERARGSSTPVRLSAYQSASPAAPAPGVPRLRDRTLRFSCCYQPFGVISCP